MRWTPSLTRLLLVVLAGVAVGVAVATSATWQQAVLAGWIAAALAYLVRSLPIIAGADAARTQAVAMAEDDNRGVAEALIVTASAASLAGAGLALHEASKASSPVGLTLSAIATVVLSWLVINVRYTLRYAHLWYTPPEGGVDFPHTDEPTYLDFAYLAFTIGMTYQVSDTNLLGPRFRGALLGHALLSYVFGAVIIATAINVVAGLL